MKRRKRTPAALPRHDPVEQTPQFQAVISEVTKAAEAAVDPAIRLGRYALVDREKQRILKEQYGIDWKTTDEMNPGWDFV